VLYDFLSGATFTPLSATAIPAVGMGEKDFLHRQSRRAAVG